MSARFLVFWLLLIGLAPAAHPAAVEPYDEVVDVTGLSGAAACAFGPPGHPPLTVWCTPRCTPPQP